MGGEGRDIISSAEGTSLVRGYGGILLQKILKFGSSKTLFSAFVMRYVSEKSTTKITESKENKSIHRLDMSGSTRPGWGGEGGKVPPPPPATALVATLFPW